MEFERHRNRYGTCVLCDEMRGRRRAARLRRRLRRLGAGGRRASATSSGWRRRSTEPTSRTADPAPLGEALRRALVAVRTATAGAPCNLWLHTAPADLARPLPLARRDRPAPLRLAGFELGSDIAIVSVDPAAAAAALRAVRDRLIPGASTRAAQPRAVQSARHRWRRNGPAPPTERTMRAPDRQRLRRLVSAMLSTVVLGGGRGRARRLRRRRDPRPAHAHAHAQRRRRPRRTDATPSPGPALGHPERRPRRPPRRRRRRRRRASPTRRSRPASWRASPQEPGLQGFDIRVVVTDGVVYLRGRVRTKAAAHAGRADRPQPSPA